MRLTRFGRCMVGSTVLLIATLTSAPRPAKATVGEDAALIIAFLQGTFTTVSQAFFQNLIQEQLLGKGNTAVVEQIAADTVGVQQALQHHVSATVEAMTRQTTEQVNDFTRREFGALGHVQIGGRLVNIGSNAPSACRRTQDAKVLERGGVNLASTQRDITDTSAAYNSRFQSQVAQTGAMSTDRRRYGDKVFALDWLQDVSIETDQDSYDRAKRSIAYATYTTPLPMPPTTQTASGAEYSSRLAQHREAVKLPQSVLARQLALRRPITGDERGRSYIEIITDWGRQAAEDAIKPAAMQVKTQAGIERENTLLLNSLVAMQAESIKAQHDTNALLAVIAARELDGRSKELRDEYAGTISAD